MCLWVIQWSGKTCFLVPIWGCLDLAVVWISRERVSKGSTWDLPRGGRVKMSDSMVCAPGPGEDFALVRSSTDDDVFYAVSMSLEKPNCECVPGRQSMAVCKHSAKVMMLLHKIAPAIIVQKFGTFCGTGHFGSASLTQEHQVRLAYEYPLEDRVIKTLYSNKWLGDRWSASPVLKLVSLQCKQAWQGFIFDLWACEYR